jgi:oligoribonuclease
VVKKEKGNLVWVDLEMTGLHVETDVILEIATIITDGNLHIIAQGPSYVIHQPAELLLHMDAWCIEHHGKSGLTEAVKQSTITLEQAYQETLYFIKHYCPERTAVLSGNSVEQDRTFLKKYMPGIIEHLHYRIIDVSTVKELVARWYADNQLSVYKKKDTHRAQQDIYESIAELQHYRTHFFV